jgi:3-hydroxybutyrate dehydrogenase
MIKLNERTIIVTGAAGGIGYAIAKGFADNGDFVAIADLNEEVAKEAASKIGSKAKGYFLDVTDEESVTTFIQNLHAERGGIHVLVNNAGIQHRDKLEDFPADKWRLLIEVMLTGPFLMTKHVLPYMKAKQFGRIINISSVHGKMASPEKSAYVSAKHGLVGLTRTTALETAKDGITANTIMPGPVKTKLLVKQINEIIEETGATQEEAMQKIMWPKQPMNRFVDPEEIAAAALFLASNQASSISGESISVSGGM